MHFLFKLFSGFIAVFFWHCCSYLGPGRAGWQHVLYKGLLSAHNTFRVCKLISEQMAKHQCQTPATLLSGSCRPMKQLLCWQRALLPPPYIHQPVEQPLGTGAPWPLCHCQARAGEVLPPQWPWGFAASRALNHCQEEGAGGSNCHLHA